ncbi:MAG: hypothetical protein RBG13Loki_0112 [Promethearchaeota archaeon CR_4]|nr:MAG: hypothetical protein RBG13Loki_0112 [Candidatus Lokiarchaeota archaeon CR_4]
MEPVVKKIIEEQGEISDEIDYALANFVANNIGFGYTPCQPALVELNNGKQVIRMGLDHTFVGAKNQLMGYGIVGYLYIDPETMDVLYCTPSEELEKGVETILNSGVAPQPRPRGKY